MFYKTFSKKKPYVNPGKKVKEKTLQEIAENPVELEKELKKWKIQK